MRLAALPGVSPAMHDRLARAPGPNVFNDRHERR